MAWWCCGFKSSKSDTQSSKFMTAFHSWYLYRILKEEKEWKLWMKRLKKENDGRQMFED